jgi:hypothetical protein
MQVPFAPTRNGILALPLRQLKDETGRFSVGSPI